ncbi:hypothetical protein [Dyella tabacisoli]|nr:hypothetical protein [Dyella tabacisoli]
MLGITSFSPTYNTYLVAGASYAGGILSAGMDGIKVAEALAQQMLGVT